MLKSWVIDIISDIIASSSSNISGVGVLSGGWVDCLCVF